MNKWTKELMIEMAETIVERLGIERRKCFLYFILFVLFNDIALILVMELL